MIRRLLAALIDASIIALLGYAGVRLAIQLASCNNLAHCGILTPLVVLFVIVAAVAYLGAGYLFGRTSFGRVFLRVGEQLRETRH